MKKVIETIVKHPITIIMVTVLLFFGGILGTLHMPLKLIPDIQIPMVSVIVPYPGASAKAVEEAVTGKLETELSNVTGVTSVHTYSYDNVSAVILEFDFGTDVDEKEDAVREKMQNFELPDACETPRISTVDLNGTATATLTVTDTRDIGTNDVSHAAKIGETLSSRILSLDGVGSVETDGQPNYVVTVQPIEGLESAALLLVQALSGGEYDLPLGDITTADGKVQIRNLSDVENMDELRALPVTLPASVVGSFVSAKRLAETYERADEADLTSFRDDVNSTVRPAIAAIDAVYAADAPDASGNHGMALRNYAMAEYYVSLLSYPMATLWSLQRSDYYDALKDNVRGKTDEELYDYVDDAEGYAGFTVGPETLFMARDEAEAADGEVKGLAKVVEFKRANGEFHEYTAADHAKFVTEAGVYATEAEATAALEFSGAYSRSGLSTFAKRRFFDEEPTNADYAELFRLTDVGNDHPTVTTEIGMRFVRSDSFDKNAEFLIAFKQAHPKPADVEDGYLTDEELFALYEGLDTDGILDFSLSLDLIRLIREKDFENAENAAVVKLSDVSVVLGPGDANYVPSYDAYAYYNGVQGVKLSVFTTAGADGTSVVRNVKKIMQDFEGEGVTYTVVLTDDQSEFISDSVMNVLVSMLIGGVLAVFVIFLFLRKVKPSAIISVTMPLSVLSALLLLFVMGITLNMVSLGGLAVGIGMLVDNSIVVIEAITKRRDAGDGAFRAAVNGTAEVAGALVGSTLTTVCVFIPILFVGGLCAEIFTDLAWAVIWSLTFSLLVAVTVIPMLYALTDRKSRMLTGSALGDPERATAPSGENAAEAEESVPAEETPVLAEAAATSYATMTAGDVGTATKTEEKPKKKKMRKGAIMHALDRLYAKYLPKVLGKKVWAVVIAAVVFAASIGLLFTTGTEFLPSVDKGLIEINLGYYGGATLTEAEADAKVIADLAAQADGVKSVSVSVGVQGLLAFNNSGVVSVKLGDTHRKTEDVADELRTLTDTARSEGKLPHTSTVGVTEIDGVVETLTGGKGGLSVTVVGEDPTKLLTIGEDVSAICRGEEFTKAGFRTLSSSMSEENTAVEYDIDFDRTALAEKNIDYATTVMTLRVGLAGYTAATVTLDGEDCDVSVSFADGTVASEADLLNFRVGTDDDGIVTLGDVAQVTVTTADTVIQKMDGLYLATVSAEVYRLDSGTAGDMMERAVADALAKIDPATGLTYAAQGYHYVASGVSSYLDNAFGGLVIALIVSFFLLFAVMAAQFESVTKPLIIMASIPFAFTGGFLALAITRMTLNVVSFVGLIMLMGVIVNNAIVMLEKIKQLTDEGMTQYDAVVEGCRTRLRPILMTTLTTVLALVPLALGLGSGGELMQPLGIVVMGGLTVGTLVTLFFIPCVYCLVKGIGKNRPNGRAAERKAKKAAEKNGTVTTEV